MPQPIRFLHTPSFHGHTCAELNLYISNHWFYNIFHSEGCLHSFRIMNLTSAFPITVSTISSIVKVVTLGLHSSYNSIFLPSRYPSGQVSLIDMPVVHWGGFPQPGINQTHTHAIIIIPPPPCGYPWHPITIYT